MTIPKLNFRRFQFSLRSLLVFITLCAIPCSWLGVKMQQARLQRDAAEVVRGLGGTVLFGELVGPEWLRSLVGQDACAEDFCDVVVVRLDGPQVTDAHLRHFGRLGHLRELSLTNTSVTDTGLKQITGLNQLRSLSLNGTKITDVGIEHLQGLKQLRDLLLNGTKVTDVGVGHLKYLDQLQTLWLCDTQVTDSGLENLRGLSHLRVLDLDCTRVTFAGVESLQQALPKCEIHR
jgi:hypothetical protein